MKIAAHLILIVIGCVFFSFVAHIPTLGNVKKVASFHHVSPRYIEKSHEETGAANYVTAVLADYRGFDTFGETIVIFCAGLVALSLLGVKDHE
ncbi:MAG: hydrogen gas-evolving membrane-bound hydrogenase subunit E [Bdellovibrionota bacterium]